MPSLRGRLASLCLLSVAACGGNPRPDPGSPVATTGPAPLSALASQRIVLLPTQSLRFDRRNGWTGQPVPSAAALHAIDSALASAFTRRGLGTRFTFAEAVIASAKRNAAYVEDPRDLNANDAIRRAEKKTDAFVQVGEPLSSQLRALAAMHDARYALVPAELSFAATAADAGTATLHVAIVDVRTASLIWFGDVHSDPLRQSTDDYAATVARRVSDLFLGPA